MLTNPAIELHELCKQLQSHGNVDQAHTHKALATIFGLESSEDPIFYSIVAALSRRFETLIRITQESSAVPDHLRDRAVGAINQLKLFCRVEGMLEIWKDRKNKVFPGEQMTALHFLGGFLQQTHPVKKITDEERKELLQLIENELAEIDREGPNSLVQDIIVSELKSLKVVLEHLTFFGIEALRDSLFTATVNVSAAESAATSSADKSTLKKASHVLGLIAAALIFTSDLIEATENIYDRGQIAIEYLVEKLPSAPTALIPHFGAVDQGVGEAKKDDTGEIDTKKPPPDGVIET